MTDEFDYVNEEPEYESQYLEEPEEDYSEISLVEEVVEKDRYEKWLSMLTTSCNNFSEVEREIDTFIKATVIYTSKGVIHDFFEFLSTKCKNEIREINDLQNAFAQKTATSKLKDYIRKFLPDRKDVDAIYVSLSQEVEKAQVYNLDQLDKLAATTEIKYLVRELIPLSKLVIVIGQPKVGKTFLASGMALAVALGRSFLGKDVIQGNALVVQNEEHLEEQSRTRFHEGLRDLEIEDPEFLNEVRTGNKLLLARNLDIGLNLKGKGSIVEYVKENNIKLVIIDSLSKSILNSGLDERSPEVPGLLFRLQEAAFLNGFSVVLLHHTNKVKAKKKEDGSVSMDDIFSSTAGNGGLLRPADSIWYMTQNPDNKAYVDISIIPRFGKPSNLVIERITGEANHWYYNLVEESTFSQEDLQVLCKLLTVFRDAHDDWKSCLEDWLDELDDEDRSKTIEELEDDYGLSPKIRGFTIAELVKETKLHKDVITESTNFMLKSDGLTYYIDNRKRKFCFSSDGSWMIKYLEQFESQQNETNAAKKLDKVMRDKLASVKNLQELKELIVDWDEEDKKRIYNLLNVEERERITQLKTAAKFAVGDKVKMGEYYLTINKVMYNKDDTNHYYQYYLEDSNGVQLEIPHLEEELEPDERHPLQE